MHSVLLCFNLFFKCQRIRIDVRSLDICLSFSHTILEKIICTIFSFFVCINISGNLREKIRTESGCTARDVCMSVSTKVPELRRRKSIALNVYCAYEIKIYITAIR